MKKYVGIELKIKKRKGVKGTGMMQKFILKEQLRDFEGFFRVKFRAEISFILVDGSPMFQKEVEPKAQIRTKILQKR